MTFPSSVAYILDGAVLREATAEEIHASELYHGARDRMRLGLPCDACGLLREPGIVEGSGVMPDPCLGGLLPGVAHACCGHGVTEKAYVSFGDYPGQPAFANPTSRYIKGEEALAWLKEHTLASDPDPDATANDNLPF